MRAHLRIAAAALALSACAHGERDVAMAPKPEREPAPRQAQIQQHGSAPPVAHIQTARPGDLEITVRATERTGEIVDPQAVPLTLQITNRREHVVSVHPALAQIEVFSGTERVEGCSGQQTLELPLFLAAGETLETSATLPCPLTEPGSYSIVATVVVGAEEGQVIAPDEVAHSGSTTLVIDEALATAGTGRMPLARVPNPESHAFPSWMSADEVEQPSG